MSTPIVKVVSVLPGWWRIVALYGAGVALMGVVFGLAQIMPIPAQLALVAQIGRIPAQLALALVPITGVLIPLSFSEQRHWRSCYEAVAVGTGLTVGLFALALWFGGFGPGRVRAALTIALYGLASVLLCLVIRLVGLWFVRSFIRRLVVQTGSLCWTCAYDLTGNESGVCPECGEAI